MSKRHKAKVEVFTCPNCQSENVIVRAETSYFVNSGDFYCHSVKTHDGDAKSMCLDCNWGGQRQELIEELK